MRQYPIYLFYTEEKSTTSSASSSILQWLKIYNEMMVMILRASNRESKIPVPMLDWVSAQKKIVDAMEAAAAEGMASVHKLYQELAVFRGLIAQIFYLAGEDDVKPIWNLLRYLHHNPYTYLREQKYKLKNNIENPAVAATSTAPDKNFFDGFMCDFRGWFKTLGEDDISWRHGMVSNTFKVLKPCKDFGVFIPKAFNAGAAIITGIIYNGPQPYEKATTAELLRPYSFSGKILVVQLITPRESRCKDGKLLTDHDVPILERTDAVNNIEVIHIPTFDHWFGNGLIPEPEQIYTLFKILQQEQKHEGAVVVFQCSGGNSRSFTFAVAYTMFINNKSLFEAVDLVKACRPSAIGQECANRSANVKDLLKKNPAQRAFLLAFYLFLLTTDKIQMSNFIRLPEKDGMHTQDEFINLVIETLDRSEFRQFDGYYYNLTNKLYHEFVLKRNEYLAPPKKSLPKLPSLQSRAKSVPPPLPARNYPSSNNPSTHKSTPQ